MSETLKPTPTAIETETDATGAAGVSDSAATATPAAPVKALKPRRALFWGLLAFYVVWMAGLATMWYLTVYRAPPRKNAVETFELVLPSGMTLETPEKTPAATQP